jgi:hypothetical protein
VQPPAFASAIDDDEATAETLVLLLHLSEVEAEFALAGVDAFGAP